MQDFSNLLNMTIAIFVVIKYNRTKELPMYGSLPKIRRLEKSAKLVAGRIFYFQKNYCLSFNKAMRAITNIPKHKSSSSVMYICITPYRGRQKRTVHRVSGNSFAWILYHFDLKRTTVSLENGCVFYSFVLMYL